MHDTLMVASLDEPFSHYCDVCETIEVAQDNGWTQFKLRPEAKFSDGSPITADDIVFSFETLVAKGAPLYRVYLGGRCRRSKPSIPGPCALPSR